MGGSAYLIHGTVAERLLAPRPLPRTWVDKLLLRTRIAAPQENGGTKQRRVSVEAPELAALIQLFHAWLAPRLRGSSPASLQMKRYLAGVPGEAFLRASAKAGEPLGWYVQLSFSGCAGMAEVSAAVASHWVHLWLLEQLSSVAQTLLVPFGFTPAEDAPASQALDERFLATAYGHASLLAEPDPGDDGGPRLVEIDTSVLEASDEKALATMRAAEAAWAQEMKEKGCRCVLCAAGG
jgi:hypothetical protein